MGSGLHSIQGWFNPYFLQGYFLRIVLLMHVLLGFSSLAGGNMNYSQHFVRHRNSLADGFFNWLLPQPVKFLRVHIWIRASPKTWRTPSADPRSFPLCRQCLVVSSINAVKARLPEFWFCVLNSAGCSGPVWTPSPRVTAGKIPPGSKLGQL